MVFDSEDDAAGSLFGYSPKMATASQGIIGTFLASIFCERINSSANQVLTSCNTFLEAEELDKVAWQ